MVRQKLARHSEQVHAEKPCRCPTKGFGLNTLSSISFIAAFSDQKDYRMWVETGYRHLPFYSSLLSFILFYSSLFSFILLPAAKIQIIF